MKGLLAAGEVADSSLCGCAAADKCLVSSMVRGKGLQKIKCLVLLHPPPPPTTAAQV